MVPMMMPRRNTRRSLPTRVGKASLDDAKKADEVLVPVAKPDADQDRRHNLDSQVPSSSSFRGKDAGRLERLYAKSRLPHGAAKVERAEEPKEKDVEISRDEPSLVSEDLKQKSHPPTKASDDGKNPSQRKAPVVPCKVVSLAPHPTTVSETNSVSNCSSPPRALPKVPSPLGVLPGGAPCATQVTSSGHATSASVRAATFFPDVTGHGGYEPTPAPTRQPRTPGLANSHQAPFPFGWNPDLPYPHYPPNPFVCSFGADIDIDMDEDMADDSKPPAVAGPPFVALSPLHREPLDSAVAEQSTNVLWTPSNHLGAVVLSLVDGTPLALLEGTETDVSELFRTGLIQATSLVHSEVKHETPASAATNPDTFPAGRKYLRWTDEEDYVLREAVTGQGPPPINWKRISRKFFRGMRTSTQCKNRWKKVLMPGLRRDPWSPEEDAIIVDGVRKGMRWGEVARLLTGRIPEQVRDHWMNQLDPTLKKEPWTEQEVEIMFRRQAEMGNKWCEIAKYLPGRSENAVKNRWHNAKVAQRRKMKKLAKEAEMADRLKEARSLSKLTEEEEFEMMKTESLKTAVHPPTPKDMR